jgi:hypothetical protein
MTRRDQDGARGGALPVAAMGYSIRVLGKNLATMLVRFPAGS